MTSMVAMETASTLEQRPGGDLGAGRAEQGAHSARVTPTDKRERQ